MRALVQAAGLVFLLIVAWSDARAQSCSCQVSDRKESAYDELLKLSNSERGDAEAIHLPFGVPVTAGASNETLLHNEHYIINYDADLRVPTWVAYRLRDLEVVPADRLNCFRRDVRIQSNEAAFCADYEEPVFDRGHMVPRSDMNRSEAAMINTFVFTNMVPQHDRFNRRIWAHFEGRVRKWTVERSEVYVITGAVFDNDADVQRDPDSAKITIKAGSEVAVPSHFYKILITDRPNQAMDALAVLLPHVDSSPSGAGASDQFLRDHTVSIRDIEAITGIDFNPAIDDGVEDSLETAVAADIW